MAREKQVSTLTVGTKIIAIIVTSIYKNDDWAVVVVIKLICSFFGLGFALVIPSALSCHHKCYCSNCSSVIISIITIVAIFCS